MSWLWFSCLALLFLLPPVSFAETHLWKYEPFRANDTDHSGGDHICDLRRDGNADGKPDRLGDYVTVSGTVIVEPSTFETGGWMFWIREGACGILVYGKQTNVEMGDSLTATGRVMITDGKCFFPETGLATSGDVGIRNLGVVRTATRGDHEAVPVLSRDYVSCPQAWAGNLITLADPVRVESLWASGIDVCARTICGDDTIVVHLDGDTHCSLERGSCYLLTGVVASIMGQSSMYPAPRWWLVPRCPSDINHVRCSTSLERTAWGHIKAEYGRDQGGRGSSP